jgi:hypothetical protein
MNVRSECLEVVIWLDHLNSDRDFLDFATLYAQNSEMGKALPISLIMDKHFAKDQHEAVNRPAD